MYVACVLGFSLSCCSSLGFIVAHYLEKKMRKLFTQHLVIKSFSLSHIAVHTESLDDDYDG